MKKDKKLFVIGTSHVADCHYNNKPREKCNAGYPDFRNGELTWPEYLGKKLNREVDNCGINAYGIDTYFYRIQNIMQKAVGQNGIIKKFLLILLIIKL